MTDTPAGEGRVEVILNECRIAGYVPESRYLAGRIVDLEARLRAVEEERAEG